MVPGLAPVAKPSQYPTTHSVEVVGVTFDPKEGNRREISSRKKRLTESVGRRGTEIRG